MHVCGFNLRLLMRRLTGVGTPRGLQGRARAHFDALILALSRFWRLVRRFEALVRRRPPDSSPIHSPYDPAPSTRSVHTTEKLVGTEGSGGLDRRASVPCGGRIAASRFHATGSGDHAGWRTKKKLVVTTDSGRLNLRASVPGRRNAAPRFHAAGSGKAGWGTTGKPFPPRAARRFVKMQTVSEYVARTLNASGVDVLFGYPGQSNLVLLAAMRSVGIRYVQAADERGAGFAAAGYIQATDKPTVVCASKGPAATNLLTPLVALDLLAIDDWMLAPLRDAERRDLTEVIEDRAERASTSCR